MGSGTNEACTDLTRGALMKVIPRRYACVAGSNGGYLAVLRQRDVI